MTARNFSDTSENASQEASATRGQHLHRQVLTGTHIDTHPHRDTHKDTNTQTRRNSGRHQNPLKISEADLPKS